MAKTKKIDALFDPTEVIEDIIRKDFDPSIFDLIDDSDFKPAKNVYDFLTSKEYLNLKPFPRQLQLCLNLFADYCPVCSDKRLAKDMFKQEIDDILSRVSLLEHGICPKCKKTRGKRLQQRLIYIPDELAACCGQRSGKSVTVAMIANYQLHRYLCLPNPSSYFGVLPNTVMHMNFIALTYGQAEDTLWDPFLAFYDNCEWFKNYNKMLSHYQKEHGILLYDVKKTFVFYNHKRLICNALGPDKRKLRGLTRFFSAIDEIGWFHGEGIKYDADEVYIALERSLRTIRSASRELHLRGMYNAPIGLSCNISSPSTANDKIMRLIREGSEDPTKIVAHYATWEFNPTIARKDLNKEFLSNPVNAARDYGADPPLADSPFYQDHRMIERSCGKHDQLKQLRWKEETHKDKFGDNSKYIDVSFNITDKITKRILTVDTGYNANAFAVAIQHLEEEKAVIDFLFEIRPTQDVPVNFVMTYDKAITEILEKLNIVYAVFDRWNSVSLEQQLIEGGVPSEHYTLKWEDFVSSRTRLSDGNIIVPKPEVPFERIIKMNEDYETFVSGKPVAHFLLQLMTVRESGRKVIKGDGFDDDLFRAVVLGQTFMFDEDYKDLFIGSGGDEKRLTRNLGKVYARSGIGNPDTSTMNKSPYLVVRTRANSQSPTGGGNMPGYRSK